jgi:hydroxymethylpyrimidine pyrophosphatase-like HAD family hydrolase
MYKSEYDVIVIGAGPGGIPAAIAAARRGMNVLLVERNACLGGLLVSGLPMLAFLDDANDAGKEALCSVLSYYPDTSGKVLPELLRLIRKPDASGLAAIVFLCVVISFPDIQQPLRQALDRILGVLLGTTIAIAVNLFRLPREKDRDTVFFVRVRDLAPDRFSQIPSAALYRLNYLYQDGAKICLISEHAPAFFTLQMSEAMLSMPLIVMGGAAIYDANDNRYLYAETIRPRDSAHLREHLDRRGLSYYLYTVHGHKTRIYHQGEFREEERVIYRRMKRSPYRDYLEDNTADPEEIVYLKLIGTGKQTAEWLADLQSLIHSRNLRAIIRKEAGTEDIHGLYLYSERVSVKNAENRLMERLRQKEPSLRMKEVFLDRPYQSERDAMQLLNLLGNLYEPIRLPWKRRKKES